MVIFIVKLINCVGIWVWILRQPRMHPAISVKKGWRRWILHSRQGTAAWATPVPGVWLSLLVIPMMYPKWGGDLRCGYLGLRFGLWKLFVWDLCSSLISHLLLRHSAKSVAVPKAGRFASQRSGGNAAASACSDYTSRSRWRDGGESLGRWVVGSLVRKTTGRDFACKG